MNIEVLFPIIVFVVLEGLFSGGELALVASDRHKIRHKAEQGSRSAKITLKLLEHPEWFLSTTLTGTNLCQIINTALATAMFISLFGIEKGELISILVMIPFILILGELVPKGIAQHYADFIAPKIAWFIWAASGLFYPFVWVLSKISRSAVYVFSKRMGVIYTSHITKSGLESLLQNEMVTGDITKSEKEMIQRILDFSDFTADRIMVPLSNVTLIPVTANLGKAADIMRKKKYSKIPVYEDDIFNIIGIVDVFDLMKDLALKGPEAGLLGDNDHNGSLRKEILYVPETQHASDLFFKLQQTREHMAIVVDEYGGAIGIITLEDILEEVVGEIGDEYHTDHSFRKVGKGRYLLNPHIKIDHVRTLLPITIPQGDYETLAGFLLSAMGRIPKPRESFKKEGILFIIEDADAKSIKEVLVVVPPELDNIIEERIGYV